MRWLFVVLVFDVVVNAGMLFVGHFFVLNSGSIDFEFLNFKKFGEWPHRYIPVLASI